MLIFLSSCGYTPIFSKKNSSFSINEMIISGDKTINKIINSKLNNYKNLEGKNLFSLNINNTLKKSMFSTEESIVKAYNEASLFIKSNNSNSILS